MFSGIRSKLRDMTTIRRLCEGAEAHALQEQQRDPGAEHFLLAAFDLPDGTAREAISRCGASPGLVKIAIERQYADALAAIGLKADITSGTPTTPNPGLYEAAPSGQALMRRLAANRDDRGPLLGAHVVAVVAGNAHGVAARALRTLGIDAGRLKSSAEAIIAEHRAG